MESRIFKYFILIFIVPVVSIINLIRNILESVPIIFRLRKNLGATEFARIEKYRQISMTFKYLV